MTSATLVPYTKKLKRVKFFHKLIASDPWMSVKMLHMLIYDGQSFNVQGWKITCASASATFYPTNDFAPNDNQTMFIIKIFHNEPYLSKQKIKTFRREMSTIPFEVFCSRYLYYLNVALFVKVNWRTDESYDDDDDGERTPKLVSNGHPENLFRLETHGGRETMLFFPFLHY